VGPGKTVVAPVPGDFILIRGASWISRLVRLAQWLRLHAGRTRGDCRWSHVALVTGHDGRIIEVVNGAVRASHITRYRAADYCYVRTGAPSADRLAAVAFAESRLGRPYGHLSLPAVVLAALTGGRCLRKAWPLHNCTALIADALSRAGAVLPRPPHRMMPADLVDVGALFARAGPGPSEARR
jgi:hypothetical protein